MVIYYKVNMCRRFSGVYTYYLKEANYKFQIVEEESYDIMIFDDSDSIYYSHPSSGGYCSMDFFLSVDSNTIYLGFHFPDLYHQTANKYIIKSITWNIDEPNPYAPYENSEKYWGFFGGCDQGRYTFGVMRNKRSYSSLEPLEWK